MKFYFKLLMVSYACICVYFSGTKNCGGGEGGGHGPSQAPPLGTALFNKSLKLF